MWTQADLSLNQVLEQIHPLTLTVSQLLEQSYLNINTISDFLNQQQINKTNDRNNQSFYDSSTDDESLQW